MHVVPVLVHAKLQTPSCNVLRIQWCQPSHTLNRHTNNPTYACDTGYKHIKLNDANPATPSIVIPTIQHTHVIQVTNWNEHLLCFCLCCEAQHSLHGLGLGSILYIYQYNLVCPSIYWLERTIGWNCYWFRNHQ